MSNIYNDVLDQLDALADVTGTAKKLMLKDMIEKDLKDILKTVLQMALNPYRTFGVRNFDPRPVFSATEPNLEHFTRQMGFLEDRSYSGRLATDALTALTMFGVPYELLIRIIRKDLRCGVGADLVNAVHPGLIRSFKVALADKYEEADFPIFVSPKFDGLRCIVLIDDENVQLLSRNGNSFPALENYKQAWLDLGYHNRMFDCEVVAGDFFQSLSVKKKKASATDAVFHTFDTMTLDQFNARSCSMTQRERLEELGRIISRDRPATDPIQFAQHALAGSNEVVMDLYDQYRALGLEGAIMKRPDAKYAFKRSSAWTKLKDVKTFDLPVKRIVEGQGQFTGNCGALVVDFRGVEVRVGTGLSVNHKTDPTKNRSWFWQKKAEIEAAWDNGTPMIVEVSAHEVTPDGSLRHPRLEKVRTDKTLADGEGV